MIYDVTESLIKLSDLVWVSNGLVPAAGATSLLFFPLPAKTTCSEIVGLEYPTSKLSLNAEQKPPFVCFHEDMHENDLGSGTALITRAEQ